MNNVKIEEYKKGEEDAISLLIQTVYDEFVSIDYSDEGNKFFNEWIEPAKIATQQLICFTYMPLRSQFLYIRDWDL